MVEWCLGHGLLGFVDAVEAMCEELLSHGDCDVAVIAALYEYFVIPFSTHASPKLATALTTRVVKLPEGTTMLSSLKHAIRTEALPTTRAATISAIDEVASGELDGWVATDVSELPVDDSPGPSTLEHFEGGGPQEEEEVAPTLTSLDSVYELSNREKPGSHFKWDQALSGLVQEFRVPGSLQKEPSKGHGPTRGGPTMEMSA